MKTDCRLFAVALGIGLFGCSSSTTIATPVDASTDAVASDAVATDAADAAGAAYPAGPYGLRQGDVFPLLSLKGYRAGVAPYTSISTSEYYDPTGSRGIRAVQLTAQTSWCGTCITYEKQRMDFATKAPNSYASKGVRFVTTLLQGPAQQPAGQPELDGWLVQIPETFDLLADPDSADAGVRAQTVWDIDGGSNTGKFAIPTVYTIDPRTMKIGKLEVGVNPADTSFAGVDAMLVKNP